MMNVLKVVAANPDSYAAIHERAMTAASNYKRCEIEMLEAIIEVEARQIYFQMEIVSLFHYCTEMLGLSRHASYNFITVMNKSKEVPALLEAIRDGSTTVSKARKICSVITERNAKDWIGLTRECSSRIVERAVAMANPREAVTESMRYVAGDVLEMKFAVSEKWSELLGDVKDLMSQKFKRAISTEETLFELMCEFMRKHDPVLKAQRAAKKSSKSQDCRKALSDNLEVMSPTLLTDMKSKDRDASISTTSPSRRYIPAKTRHAVALRDNGKCTFVDRHDKRCGSRRWTQTHHVHHFANGGSHAVENLETLCWAHHVMKHRDSTSFVT